MKLFCKHEKEHIAHLDGYPSRIHLHKCKKCGSLFYYDKFDDRSFKIKHPEKYGKWVYDSAEPNCELKMN